jgi:hypothetical protein
MWGFTYPLSLYTSAIASAGAGLVLKLDFLKGSPHQTDWAAVLAGSAAIISTITAVGGFNRKWFVNRSSRSGIELLRIDLSDPSVDGNYIRNRLKEIILKHDEGIDGPESNSLAGRRKP